MIYNEDGMNAVDRESAVKHIGYSGVNGASATALASLKQFGLVSDAGKGMIRLTSLALDIIEPENEHARAGALREAALNPDLFASLRDRFPEKVPSESNLRAHLVRQGFTSAAIKPIVAAYLGTHEYIATLEESESYGGRPDKVQESSGGQHVEGFSMSPNLLPATVTAPVPPVATSAPTIPGSRRMVFDTQEGEAMFTYPDGLSAESVDDLEAWFALVVKRLRRATAQ